MIMLLISAEAQVAQDVDQQKCGGVIDQAKELAGTVGESVAKTMKQLALEILQRQVVNEERVLQKGSITIYTKM